jgi:hypothetical protein
MDNTEGAKTEEDPAHPEQYTHLRMWGHIMQKGWQVGSVIGTMVVLPIALYTTRDTPKSFAAAGRALPAGVLFAGEQL